MPAIEASASDTVTEWRLPPGGSFVITDEVGTELFRVSASGDVVKVEGITLDPTLQAILNAVTASAAELNLTDGLTATTAELNAVADLSAINVARTATADGTGTGTITAIGVVNFVTVTAADADKIIVLPAPAPGTIVILVNGATGYELRTSAPATIAINGGAEANAESAIAASTLVVAICKSATAWAAFSLAGTTLAAVEAAAAA